MTYFAVRIYVQRAAFASASNCAQEAFSSNIWCVAWQDALHQFMDIVQQLRQRARHEQAEMVACWVVGALHANGGAGAYV